jgi:mono/diheme cytochrome c family protein
VKRRKSLRKLAFIAVLTLATPAAAEPDAAKLYAGHCASCHGDNRLGGQGPALLPESLGRLMGPRAATVIAQGRVATQMPAFAQTLNKPEIDALAAYIATPLATIPAWGERDIAASRVVYAQPATLTRPAYDADPMNLFVVVETGDHLLHVARRLGEQIRFVDADDDC